MELLYLWINCSEHGIFKKQEVLISGKYNISFNQDENRINITENEEYYNIFENDIISNVTALVGTNGAGKTTLLNYIYNNDIMPKLDVDKLEYIENTIAEYEKSKTVQVFKNCEQLIVIHNLEVEIKAPDNVKVISMNQDTFIEMSEKKSYLNSVTKIYLTNGNYYDSNGYASENGEPSKIILSLESIRTFKSDFFKKVVRFPQGLIQDNL